MISLTKASKNHRLKEVGNGVSGKAGGYLNERQDTTD
jgi:hypothetical protein